MRKREKKGGSSSSPSNYQQKKREESRRSKYDPTFIVPPPFNLHLLWHCVPTLSQRKPLASSTFVGTHDSDILRYIPNLMDCMAASVSSNGDGA